MHSSIFVSLSFAITMMWGYKAGLDPTESAYLRLYDSLMNGDLFEVLLHEDESETLGFKADQYPFEGATRPPSTDKLSHIRPRSSFHNRRVAVSEHGDFYEVRVGIGTVQPGMNEWSAAEIFIGSSEPFDLTIQMTISADNLRLPVASHSKNQGRS
jgi:hypothetical protein